MRIPKSIPELTPQDRQRLNERIDRTPGLGPHGTCWEWRGETNGVGYGQMTLLATAKRYLVHRITFILLNGAPPADRSLICHTCDNPLCCNPTHLFAGSVRDNAADMLAKGRFPTGDRHWMRARPEIRARGDRHGLAKLRERDIPEIVAAFNAGETPKRLADMYGVSKASVLNIFLRKTWAHIDIRVTRPVERVRRGGDNGRARLTEAEVLHWRAAADNGISIRSIAETSGVPRSTIEKAIMNATWRHLPPCRRFQRIAV